MKPYQAVSCNAVIVRFLGFRRFTAGTYATDFSEEMPEYSLVLAVVISFAYIPIADDYCIILCDVCKLCYACLTVLC